VGWAGPLRKDHRAIRTHIHRGQREGKQDHPAAGGRYDPYILFMDAIAYGGSIERQRRGMVFT